MSMLKSLASFVFSTLFIIFLYVAITSYTMGNLVQKENLEGFIQSQLKESIAPQTCDDICSNEYYQSCEDYCNNLNNTNMTDSCNNTCLNSPHNLEIEQGCVQTCLSRSNESQQYISKTIDEFYSNKIVDDTSLNDVVPIIRNNVLFIVFSFIFGLFVLLVSEKPVSKTGSNLVWVAISLLSIAIIPAFLTTSEVSVVKIISDYVMQSLYQQAYIGIILLVIGIIFILIGKKKGK